MTYTSPQTANTAANASPTARIDDEPMATASNGFEDKITASESFILYPNPTLANDINLMLNSEEEKAVSVKVIDIQGREVYTEQVTLYRGSNDFRLKVAQRLETGLYVVQIPELGMTKKVNIR
jgi:alpha-amylase